MQEQENLNVYNLYKEMTENNILTAFLGDFNHSITTSLLNKFKRKMAFLETTTGINKKVYNVMVECLENVSRHKVCKTKNKDVPSDLAIFLLQKNQNTYCVITGNYIHNRDKQPLYEHIDKINLMSKEELKEFYRGVISLPYKKDKNKAGLGLIDIALKSENPLYYHFKAINNQFTFVTMQITINFY